RQGNPKLFGMICAHYKFSDDGANRNLLSTLELSYRSSVPVIETVNKVFQTTLFPPADEKGMLRRAIKAMQFKTHSSAPTAAAQPGCVMMAEMPEKDVRKKAYAIAELIRKLDPFNPQRKKSLTVGILVRTNDSGTELADILIGEGLNVTVDGKLDPTQSLAFSAYKQMLRLAAHPADKMAQGFLDMLRFDGQKVSLPDAEEIRKIITRQGFYAFTHKFMKIFHGMTPFDLSRMKVVETAALRADQSENRTIDEFLAELDLLKESASSIRNTVQIMTIHKSKGLDFDIVIMPETSRSNGNIVKRRHSNDIAIRKDENGLEAQWISFLPNSAFIPLLPEVRKYSEEADFAACYENCCNLYVAMTRARNALYIFNDPAPENATAVQYADFLRAALEGKCPIEKIEQGRRFTDDFMSPVCVSYVCGDPEWFRKDTPRKDKELTPSGLAEKQEKDFRLKLREESRIETVIPVKRPCRIKPSAAHEKEQTYIFREQKAADLGTRLHDILAEFGFYTNDSDVSAFLQNRCTAAEELQLLSSFFRSPEIQNALLMPAGRYELWREKRFLSTLDNGIINGCFDRVLIRLADDGTIVDAEILDYKSDRDVTPETLQERHAPQLDLYRKVLANLIHLDSAKIRCTLLSIRYGFAVSF
ncbi:MAG: PD-(D/E)XK nuclease family protein, partial [Lentisphaeria bacterium]|nr:PD-(D/E)XK nuclease family protein [Lentisphaeria bacterium]